MALLYGSKALSAKEIIHVMSKGLILQAKTVLTRPGGYKRGRGFGLPKLITSPSLPEHQCRGLQGLTETPFWLRRWAITVAGRTREALVQDAVQHLGS